MCLDYIYLGITHALQECILMASFVIKMSFIVIELALIIAFQVTEHTQYNENNMAATLEWGMYLFSLTFRLCINLLDNSHCLCLHWLHSLFDCRSAAISSEEAPRFKGISTTRNEHRLGLARLDSTLCRCWSSLIALVCWQPLKMYIYISMLLSPERKGIVPENTTMGPGAGDDSENSSYFDKEKLFQLSCLWQNN